MCPPPCGPRRAWRSPREKRPIIKTRISKSEVREIIGSGNYECLYRDDLTKVNATYDGCTDNLLMNYKKVVDYIRRCKKVIKTM